jgi:hypothetical protein
MQVKSVKSVVFGLSILGILMQLTAGVASAERVVIPVKSDANIQPVNEASRLNLQRSIAPGDNRQLQPTNQVNNQNVNLQQLDTKLIEEKLRNTPGNIRNIPVNATCGNYNLY